MNHGEAVAGFLIVSLGQLDVNEVLFRLGFDPCEQVCL
jgi:hypothetical protein